MLTALFCLFWHMNAVLFLLQGKKRTDKSFAQAFLKACKGYGDGVPEKNGALKAPFPICRIYLRFHREQYRRIVRRWF